MKRILLVEDDQLLCEAISKKLAKAGFEISDALNGQEGLDKSLLLHPDLILLDILMPTMDGMTMLKKLRENSWGKNVPVIILTNLSDSAEVEEAKKLNVQGYLIKSNWKLEDVLKMINLALS